MIIYLIYFCLSAVTGYLVYSTRTYINTVSLLEGNVAGVPEILDTEISHIAVYPKYGRVFWVENTPGGYTAKAIKSTILNDTKQVVVVQNGFHGHVGGIAIDWISENIYWSQQLPNSIEVSKSDGRFRTKLIEKSEDVKISLVTVNPLER